MTTADRHLNPTPRMGFEPTAPSEGAAVFKTAGNPPFPGTSHRARHRRRTRRPERKGPGGDPNARALAEPRHLDSGAHRR